MREKKSFRSFAPKRRVFPVDFSKPRDLLNLEKQQQVGRKTLRSDTTPMFNPTYTDPFFQETVMYVLQKNKRPPIPSEDITDFSAHI